METIALSIIAMAFIWLLYDTDYLTVRLPYGKATELKSDSLEMQSNDIYTT